MTNPDQPRHRTVFVTDRPAIHQQTALDAAPDILQIKMLESPDRQTIVDALADAEFMISERAGAIDADMIHGAPKLKLIQRLGTRSHDIDLAAATKAGIAVCCQPLQQSVAVAEHTMALMLALVKRLRDVTEETISGTNWGPPIATDANTFAINWSDRQGISSLHGATVGIVGLGEIGTQVANRLRPFGAEILYHNPTKLPDSLEREQGVRWASLHRLIAESDIICLLVPWSAQTEGMTDHEFLAATKPGAILISTGASTTLDEAAVADAYRSGQLSGVATDGYRFEPIQPDNPLISLAEDRRANVILTPHCALGNMELGIALRSADYVNIINFLSGHPLLDRLA